MSEEQGSIVANDGTRIHYEARGAGRPLVMIHGWCFSGRFFSRVVPALAERCRVITVDLRGHGDSDKPGHGYRIARLAKDLHDLLAALGLSDVTLLGWSIGSPVIWSYLELFGIERVARVVFVDQAPRAYRGLDWEWATTTAFDDAALATTLTQMSLQTAQFDESQVDGIVERALGDEERRMLLAEMAKAPAGARAAVMTDHVHIDWRDLLPTISVPSLVLVARKGAEVDWRGPATVGELIPGARTEFFEDSSHALFLDEPERFERLIGDFVVDAEAPSGG
jgi:pimeloyl-ACP methyl ester carboxylesterase